MIIARYVLRRGVFPSVRHAGVLLYLLCPNGRIDRARVFFCTEAVANPTRWTMCYGYRVISITGGACRLRQAMVRAVLDKDDVNIHFFHSFITCTSSSLFTGLLVRIRVRLFSFCPLRCCSNHGRRSEKKCRGDPPLSGLPSRPFRNSTS